MKKLLKSFNITRDLKVNVADKKAFKIIFENLKEFRNKMC